MNDRRVAIVSARPLDPLPFFARGLMAARFADLEAAVSSGAGLVILHDPDPETLRRLADVMGVRVIVVLPRGSNDRAVTELLAIAADVEVEPVSADLLAAHAAAALRQVRIGDALIDLGAHLISRPGVPPVTLRSMDFQLLSLLLEASGRFCSLPELEAQLWPTGDVPRNSVKSHVFRLRRLLGPGAIETGRTSTASAYRIPAGEDRGG
jgi:DNA-binding response OmpR family regulator